MRKFAGAAAVALLLSAPANATGVAAVGQTAPAFRLADFAGKPLTLHNFRGRPVFINVFASWCPPCRGEIPSIVAAAVKYASRVDFLGVDAQEPAGTARRFAKQLHIGYRVGIDRGQMAVSYGAASLPESVFIDRGGVIRAIVHGTIGSAVLERNLALIAR